MKGNYQIHELLIYNLVDRATRYDTTDTDIPILKPPDVKKLWKTQDSTIMGRKLDKHHTKTSSNQDEYCRLQRHNRLSLL